MKKRSPFRTGIKSIFLAGIITVLPLGFTIFVVIFLINLLGNIAGRVLKYVPWVSTLHPYVITIIGFFTLIVVIFVVGLITSSFIGRWLLRLTDRFFSKLPFIRSVYSSARQLTDTLFIDRSALKEVVIIEYPRKGIYTLAFVTNDDTWQIKRRGTVTCVNVFVPTSPNPTSGYYLLVPEKDIIPTGLPIEWGFKIIVSGGIVLPKERKIRVASKR
jgi:uncharacterized membrane protein